MTNTDISRITERKEMAETKVSVFKKKSQEYIDFCINEYSKYLSDITNLAGWFDTIERVETEAKKRFCPELLR